MEGVRLKRLKIDKYRNVAPGTELVFNSGFNILLGKNGTGKTTLLRLIAMVVTGTFRHLKDDAFGLEYELAVAGLRMIAAIKNEPRKGRTELPLPADNAPIDASPLQSESTWSCEFTILLAEGSEDETLSTISIDPLKANLHFGGKDHPIAVRSPFEYNPLLRALLSLTEIVARSTSVPSSATRASWGSVRQRLSSTLMLFREGTMVNGGRFDEALGALDVITANRIHDDAGDICEVALFVMAHDNGFATGGTKFIPRQLLDAILAKPRPDILAGNLQFDHEDLRFLQKMVDISGVRRVTMVAALDRKQTSDEFDAFTYNGFEFRVTLADGTIISHRHLSYGQKRLLSFLYYAACNPDIVIADELVNGLHYEWISVCLQEIQDRQSFLTSQNPVLLDMLPFSSADDVQRSFILCSNEVRDGRVQMVWRTMSEQTADAFYRAYDTQALQVSEILRTNDLW
jgi:energy-coupling factor transporter ATP-binding protein EcfA2